MSKLEEIRRRAKVGYEVIVYDDDQEETPLPDEQATQDVLALLPVIDAADGVFNEAEYYPDADAYLVSQDAFNALLAALDAIKPLPDEPETDA